MNGKLYIKKFIRDDGETLSFDAEEIYLSEDNTLLVRSDPATTAVDFTEADGGEMIRQRGAVYHQTIKGLIVPKTSDYWSLCTRLSRFFVFNHTYKIVYVKVNGSMFATNGAWISSGLQIVPVPHENYSYWNIEFAIGNIYWAQYAENSEGEQIYSNSITLPLITASMGGELWDTAELQTLSGEGSTFQIEGTSISATNTDVRLKGDTFQQTYTGKNLSPYPYSFGDSYIGKGIMFTAAPDGSVTLNGANDGTGNSAYMLYNNTSSPLQFEAGTYYLIPPSNTSVGYVMYDGTTYYDFDSSNNYSRTFPDTKSMRQVYIQVRRNDTTVFNNFKVYPMLTTLPNQMESDYEPYVGGTPAPNPDYPQDIHVATGEQTVNIVGKNLFPLSRISSSSVNGVTFTNNGDSISIQGTADANIDKGLHIPLSDIPSSLIKNGSRYTLSLSQALPTGVNVRVSFYSSTAFVNYVAYLNGDGNRTSSTGNVITIPENATRIRWFINVQNGTNVNISNLKIQLTEGTTPDYDFEPYQNQSYTIDLGSTELCKIGDYQDYIYKSGDDWYLHKDCEKIAFNSSTGWMKHSTTQGNVFTLASTGLVGYAYNSGQIAPALMDTDRVIELGSMADNAYGVFGVTNAGHLRVFRGDYDSSYTAAEFKSEMTGHYIYGALATPTNTKITDATLVAQLNALATARAYSGTTIYSTSGTPLPVIFHIEMTQSVGEGEVWDNVGGVWEAGSGGVQTISVDSTQKIYPVWTVTGPCVNPVLQNNTTDTFASFDGTVAAGQTLTVYFEDGIAYLDSAIATRYVSGYVSFLPGENMVGFNSDGGSAESSTISWDNIIN